MGEVDEQSRRLNENREDDQDGQGRPGTDGGQDKRSL
jgi:hypothetical protein